MPSLALALKNNALGILEYFDVLFTEYMKNQL